MIKKKGCRLDQELVNRALAPSRDKAKALIMAGEVLVNGQCEIKADKPINVGDELSIKEKYPYVSRGAYKLEAAVQNFIMEIQGRCILDVGISTGGFCDYLLQHGAAQVMGIDVNIQQVSDRLRSDQRVFLLEKNIKNLQALDLPHRPDWVVIDLSFISILRALDVLTFLGDIPILGMVKPQFEAPKGSVGKGGVIRDRHKIEKILLDLKQSIQALGYGVLAITPAGIKGKKGNQEFFFLLKYGQKSNLDDKMLSNATKAL